MQDTVTGDYYRADHLLEGHLEKLVASKETPADIKTKAEATLPLVDGMSGDKAVLWACMQVCVCLLPRDCLATRPHPLSPIRPVFSGIRCQVARGKRRQPHHGACRLQPDVSDIHWSHGPRQRVSLSCSHPPRAALTLWCTSASSVPRQPRAFSRILSACSSSTTEKCRSLRLRLATHSVMRSAPALACCVSGMCLCLMEHSFPICITLMVIAHRAESSSWPRSSTL